MVEPCTSKYVSDGLKNDREIVMAAVKQDGHALQYAIICISWIHFIGSKYLFVSVEID